MSSRYKFLKAGALCVLLLAALVPTAAAAQAERSVRVRIPRGRTRVVVRGTVMADGRGGDYVFRAREGQTLVINFAAGGDTAFGMTAPNGDNLAGEGSGPGRAEFQLTQTGDYHVFVINRDNKRRRFKFTFTIR